MPVRPEELLRHTVELIVDDRACLKCGYSLRGLKTDAKCPECGRPIRKPKAPARFADMMVNAPLAWLRGYVLGTLLLFVGGWVAAGSLLGWTFTASPLAGGAAVVGAVVWAAGAVLATRPRPRTKATEIEPEKEWAISRLLARVTQPAWALGIAAMLAAQLADKFNLWVFIISGACLAVGSLGLWPLMLVQSNLAYWASDTDLAGKLRNTPWILLIGLGIGMGVGAVIQQGAVPTVTMSVLFFAMWLGVILATLGYGLLALWQLWRMAHWVTLNHVGNYRRDERLRQRAARAK